MKLRARVSECTLVVCVLTLILVCVLLFRETREGFAANAGSSFGPVTIHQAKELAAQAAKHTASLGPQSAQSAQDINNRLGGNKWEAIQEKKGKNTTNEATKTCLLEDLLISPDDYACELIKEAYLNKCNKTGGNGNKKSTGWKA